MYKGGLIKMKNEEPTAPAESETKEDETEGEVEAETKEE